MRARTPSPLGPNGGHGKLRGSLPRFSPTPQLLFTLVRRGLNIGDVEDVKEVNHHAPLLPVNGLSTNDALLSSTLSRVNH